MWPDFLNFGSKGNDAPQAPQQTQAPDTTTVTPPANDPPADPLDQYKDWFAKDDKPNPNSIDAVVGNMFNLTDESLDKDLGGVNLIQMNQEQLTKMRAGGDEGLQATLEVLQNSMRNVLKQATKVSGSFVQHGLKNSTSLVDQRVTSTMARSNAEQAVMSLGGFDNPVMATFREPIVSALAKQFPNASQDSLKTHASGMLDAMLANMGYQKREAAPKQELPKGADFSNWMGGN